MGAKFSEGRPPVEECQLSKNCQWIEKAKFLSRWMISLYPLKFLGQDFPMFQLQAANSDL